MVEEELTGKIIDAAICVHRELGPGLLESAYQGCLHYELQKRGLRVRKEVELPVVYDGHYIDVGYRIDLLVEERVIIEVKAVERMLPIFEAQLLTYLRLSGKRVGLLMNFNTKLLKDGLIRRVL